MSEKSIIEKFKENYSDFIGSDAKNPSDPTILLLEMLAESESIGQNYYDYYISEEYNLNSHLASKLFNYNLSLNIPYKYNLKANVKIKDSVKPMKLQLPKYTSLKSKNSNYVLENSIIINNYNSTESITLVQGELKNETINSLTVIGNSSRTYKLTVSDKIYANVGFLEIDNIQYTEYSIINAKYSDSKICYGVELSSDGSYYLIFSQKLFDKIMNNSKITLNFLVKDIENDGETITELTTDPIMVDEVKYEISIDQIIINTKMRDQLRSTTLLDFDTNISKFDYEENANSLESVILAKAYDCSDIITKSIIELEPDNPEKWDVKLTFPESDSFNIISYPYSDHTKTVNGITFTDNGDKSITVNGTATGRATFLVSNLPISQGIYKLSGCPTGGSRDKYSILCNAYNGSTWINAYYDIGDGIILDTTNSDINLISIYINITSGTIINNLVFMPKLTNKLILPIPYYMYMVVASENLYTESIMSIQLKREIMNSLQNGLLIKEVLLDYGTNFRDEYKVSKGNQGYQLDDNYRPYQLPYIIDSRNPLTPILDPDNSNRTSRYNMPDLIIQLEPASYVPIDVNIKIDLNYDTLDDLMNFYLSLVDSIKSLFELSKTNDYLKFNSKVMKSDIDRVVYQFPEVNYALIDDFYYYRNNKKLGKVKEVQLAPFELPVLGKLTIYLDFKFKSMLDTLYISDESLNLKEVEHKLNDKLKIIDKSNAKIILNLTDSLKINDNNIRINRIFDTEYNFEITYWLISVTGDQESLNITSYSKSIITVQEGYSNSVDDSSKYKDDDNSIESGLFTDSVQYIRKYLDY